MPNIYRSVMSSSSPPAVLQSKTVTAGTSDILVEPDAGYDGLSDVTVEPTPSQSKSATPTTSAQTITPDSGKLLSSVSVGAIPSDYVIPTSITPSNTSPVSMVSGSAYKPSESGYVISSYSSVTPSSSSSGASFSSGMVKMSDSGVAFTRNPSGTFTRTTLWTNSNSTSTSFAQQTVSLSQSMTNFNYLQFNYYITSAASDNYETKCVIYPVNYIQNTGYATNKLLVALNGATSSSSIRTRNAEWVSNTQIKFHSTRLQSSSGTTTTYMIPVSIEGLLFSIRIPAAAL